MLLVISDNDINGLEQMRNQTSKEKMNKTFEFPNNYSKSYNLAMLFQMKLVWFYNEVLLGCGRSLLIENLSCKLITWMSKQKVGKKNINLNVIIDGAATITTTKRCVICAFALLCIFKGTTEITVFAVVTMCKTKTSLDTLHYWGSYKLLMHFFKISNNLLLNFPPSLQLSIWHPYGCLLGWCDHHNSLLTGL